MAITLAEETFAQFWTDAQPLFEKHFLEIATWLDIPLLPSKEFYEHACEAGRIAIYAARDGQQLVGYAVFFVAPHPHYSTSTQAVQDVVFVEKSRRGAMIGKRLIAFSETKLRARGCQVVHHHVKLRHPTLARLLERYNYEPTETIYSKRLDKEPV